MRKTLAKLASLAVLCPAIMACGNEVYRNNVRGFVLDFIDDTQTYYSLDYIISATLTKQTIYKDDGAVLWQIESSKPNPETRENQAVLHFVTMEYDYRQYDKYIYAETLSIPEINVTADSWDTALSALGLD